MTRAVNVVTADEEGPMEWIDPVEMPEGTFGVDTDGNVYYRHVYGIACLNDCGRSYTWINNPPTGFRLRLSIVSPNSLLTIITGVPDDNLPSHAGGQVPESPRPEVPNPSNPEAGRDQMSYNEEYNRDCENSQQEAQDYTEPSHQEGP